MDTIPHRKLRPKKFPVPDQQGGKYYKRGGYICEVCPYAEDKVCATCIFARWNVEGVLAGYSPEEAYRRAHQDEISASPLLTSLAVRCQDSIHLKLTPVAVPSHNQLAKLLKHRG